MIINKIVLEKDLSILEKAEVLRMKYKGKNLINKLETSDYKILKTITNDKVLHEINNDIDIGISSNQKYKVLGYELEDGTYIFYDDMVDDTLEFKDGSLSLIKENKLDKDLVNEYKSENHITFAISYDTNEYVEVETYSNKRLQVLNGELKYFVNIPVILRAPKAKYKSEYLSDEDYLRLVCNIIKDNDKEIDVNDIIPSIQNIISREVI